MLEKRIRFLANVKPSPVIMALHEKWCGPNSCSSSYQPSVNSEKTKQQPYLSLKDLALIIFKKTVTKMDIYHHRK
jgi:hypothetical protein